MPIVSRHGGGLNDGDYINMNMLGANAKLVELQTRNELKNNPVGDTGLLEKDSVKKMVNEFKADQEIPE